MNKHNILKAIENAKKSNGRIIVAIDGRCASGKTTLANYIAENIDCDVVHTDDFFLPPEKRTAERLSEAGGNMDRERLLSEILLPIKNGENYVYNKFSCKTMKLLCGENKPSNEITIVEGSYSCHPDLFELYDLHIFVDVDGDTQKQRILQRNKTNADDFFRKWIPLEEKYFTEFDIKNKCEIAFTI